MTDERKNDPQRGRGEEHGANDHGHGQDDHSHNDGHGENGGRGNMVTIIIDGTPHEVEKGEMTYAQIVTLADPEYPQHPETTYSVTYKRGHGNKPEGTLSPGGSVKVKDGMVFNVSRTGQS